jgi:hypothetical protein
VHHHTHTHTHTHIYITQFNEAFKKQGFEKENIFNCLTNYEFYFTYMEFTYVIIIPCANHNTTFSNAQYFILKVDEFFFDIHKISQHS